MIVAEGLTKRYGARTAIDGLSFTVPRGEVVGFLGPNGAGKSTTLRVLSGYVPPSAGRATIDGLDVVEDSLRAREKVGYMPEAVPLYPELRVSEYLSFRAEIKGVKRSARKAAVQRAMELADVADVARRLIGELSKGYKQRVGLADALVASPPLLILDEPTAGLDPNQILHVRELVRTLGKDHTIFLSTHILPEVEAVCSRVVIIHRGKIVAEGTPDAIRARLAGEESAVELVARGDEDALRKALGALSELRLDPEPAVVVDPAAGVRRYLLHVAGDKPGEVVERATAALVGAGLGVRAITSHGRSLEDIFRELTTRDPGADDAKPEAKPSGEEASR